jgi:flagellar biosynthesis/type III secretory pathway M-ring protein FliF/YscJ
MLANSSDRQRAGRVAMFKELSSIIRALPYVKNAAVVYDAKPRSGFSQQPKTNATATVTPRGSQQLDGQQVLAIRSIVAGGFGLQPGDVIVVDTNGRTHNATKTGDVAAGDDNPFFRTKVTHERNWEDKIRNALSYIPDVRVTVDVDLDRTTKTVSDQIVIDTEAVVVLQSRSDKRSNTTTQSKGGRVGLAAQSGANSAQSLGGGGGGAESVQKDELKEDTKTAPHEEIHKELAGLTPKEVKVAVSVPTTYLEQVFHQQQEPAAEGEEPAQPTEQQLADIKSEVEKSVTTLIPSMIPIPQGLNPDDVVTVAFVTPVTLDDVEGPPITETATSWLAMNWSTLGMLGFAGLGLMMLRSMLKSTPSVAPLATGVQAHAAGTTPDEDAAEPAPHKRQLRRSIPSGPNLAEELAEIVREDSEAAANVLRGWITSGT